MANKIAAQATQGPIDKVPCPYCAKPNDFTEVDHLIAESDLSQGTGDPGGGPIFNCDHCGQKMRVVAMRVVKLLTVRQVG